MKGFSDVGSLPMLISRTTSTYGSPPLPAPHMEVRQSSFTHGFQTARFYVLFMGALDHATLLETANATALMPR